MNVKQALLHLKLDEDFEEDNLQDAFEEQVFELKKYFLSNAILSKLFLKRLSQLEQIQLAFESLGGETQLETVPSFSQFPSIDKLDELISFCETELAQYKTALSKAFTYPAIAAFVIQMLSLQDFFEQKYLNAFKSFINDLPSFEGTYNSEVKLAQVQDSAILKKALNTCSISTYFVYLDNMPTEALYTCLTEAFRISKLRDLKP